MEEEWVEEPIKQQFLGEFSGSKLPPGYEINPNAGGAAGAHAGGWGPIQEAFLPPSSETEAGGDDGFDHWDEFVPPEQT